MPSLQIPRKLERILTTKARFVVVIGGRSSGKSEGIGRLLLMLAQTQAADVLCGREYQNSIADSCHKLIKSLIPKTGAVGFDVTEQKIDCVTGGGFRFKGFSRSPDAVKSAQDFKYSWIEEAQALSQQSIDDLLPTIRAKGSKLFFTANPQSSADPFSKRFIVPYHSQLLSDGYYEDDLHLIILCNWRDNPWHGELESQRVWDYANLPRALYDHIWEGAFNDSVGSSLIKAEWFDSCIDAHKRLGFSPAGLRMAAHDPSDEGGDPKGYAMRHGSVVLAVDEMTTGDVTTGCDWATGQAIRHSVDAFTWDCDGLGAGLARIVGMAFEGKRIVTAMFKGSEDVDFPDAIYKPVDASMLIQDQPTNKEVFRNKRVQYYAALRDRVLKTHNAVHRGIYSDPADMISFDGNITALAALRSELCRMPIKPNGNGLLDLYTKDEMKTRFKFRSPNLADSVAMLMRQPHIIAAHNHKLPRPAPKMGGKTQWTR